MSRIVPQSQAVPMVRIRVNNSTDTSYPSRVATTALPTANDGVYDLGFDCPNNVEIIPFGQSANDETFLMRVLGWKQVGKLYVPIELWEGTITLGASQGTGSWVASTTIAADSNNVALPVSTINLTSTSGFTSAGSVLINTSAGPQIVNYTAISGNQLLNCVGGNGTQNNGQVTGTMVTGGAVMQWGVLGDAVTASDFFADTITTSVGNAGVDCQPLSPANDQIAHLMVDAKGCSFIECLFTNSGGTAVQMNALVGML